MHRLMFMANFHHQEAYYGSGGSGISGPKDIIQRRPELPAFKDQQAKQVVKVSRELKEILGKREHGVYWRNVGEVGPQGIHDLKGDTGEADGGF